MATNRRELELQIAELIQKREGLEQELNGLYSLLLADQAGYSLPKFKEPNGEVPKPSMAQEFADTYWPKPIAKDLAKTYTNGSGKKRASHGKLMEEARRFLKEYGRGGQELEKFIAEIKPLISTEGDRTKASYNVIYRLVKNGLAVKWTGRDKIVRIRYN